MKQSLSKKLCSILLVLIMLIGLIPTGILSVSAATGVSMHLSLDYDKWTKFAFGHVEGEADEQIEDWYPEVMGIKDTSNGEEMYDIVRLWDSKLGLAYVDDSGNICDVGDGAEMISSSKQYLVNYIVYANEGFSLPENPDDVVFYLNDEVVTPYKVEYDSSWNE